LLDSTTDEIAIHPVREDGHLINQVAPPGVSCIPVSILFHPHADWNAK
jgi:hypothetical protein